MNFCPDVLISLICNEAVNQSSSSFNALWLVNPGYLVSASGFALQVHQRRQTDPFLSVAAAAGAGPPGHGSGVTAVVTSSARAPGDGLAACACVE